MHHDQVGMENPFQNQFENDCFSKTELQAVVKLSLQPLQGKFLAQS